MPHTIRFALAIHNHQPVGNFDGVFQQAYDDSYRPFLDVFERYAGIKLSLHVSGPLAEWLDRHHPDYLDRLADLVHQDRLEILGGAFYEPILTMVPPQDRVGQVRAYSDWLRRRLGAEIRGLWIPERVWEQSLVSDLATAGMQYTVLDDFHFKAAGLTTDDLTGYFITEDNGQLLSVFPGSERLRYTMPFADPDQTIDCLRQIAERRQSAVIVFGDDGEKFGTWPETKKHVYDDGWLARFFDALSANREWIQVTTLAEAIDNVPPAGKVYLPDCSYREMTEWVLPVERLSEYERVRHELEHDPRWPAISQFVRGGNWRNYKVKYPEANEMYCRMLQVSQRVQELSQSGQVDAELLEQARMELYRGQCNCAYWHGAFGGIYLPHLRNAVYQHLIAADNLLEEAAVRQSPFVEDRFADFNLDARKEILLANDKLLAFLSPREGGELYELDVRAIRHNLLATLARRPEAYHRKVLAGAQQARGEVASIHERIVFKQPGLDERLQYDAYPRKSLLDHFYDNDVTLAAVARGDAPERGDFIRGVYEARVRRAPDRAQAVLSRAGSVGERAVRITKAVVLEAGGSKLQVAYALEDLPQEPLHFAVELNFAGLPAGADDRYFYDTVRGRLGQLGTWLDLANAVDLNLVDQWLGIDVGLKFSRQSGVWAFPVETVSQSEGGFELVHQSVAVVPHWIVTPDATGQWRVTIQLDIDTSQAAARVEQAGRAQTAVVSAP
ncbi:MAG: DUF1926 domain-containing protein [Planctomycetia bacterium]|nr:DUF1926 domain-containing protein [Planctomycetia bacterium]